MRVRLQFFLGSCLLALVLPGCSGPVDEFDEAPSPLIPSQGLASPSLSRTQSPSPESVPLPPGLTLAGSDGCCGDDGQCHAPTLYNSVEVCQLGIIGSDEVQAAMADDRITRDEYEAAFRRYRACMERQGTPLANVDISGEKITFTYPDGPKDLNCYDTHFYTVDLYWQVIETAPPSEVRELEIAHLIACIDSAGIEPVVAAVPALPRDQVLAAQRLKKQIQWDQSLTPAQVDACLKTS